MVKVRADLSGVRPNARTKTAYPILKCTRNRGRMELTSSVQFHSARKLIRKGISMQTIKSVGVLSVAKIMGFIYGTMALIFVPFVLLFGLLGAMGAMASTEHSNPFAALGVIGVVLIALFIPIVYGVMGFIAGAIGALIYNLMAKWVGGIQIESQSQAVGQYAAGQGA
jgi:hypothetical protein